MKRFAGLLATACALALPTVAKAALSRMTGLFVFGDSWSDGGNSGLASQAFAGYAVIFPPPPYYNGQYSNGPVAVEYLWKSFNPGSNAFKPSLAGGTNYAIGGATTGLESFNSVNASVPDFLKPAYVEKSNAWQLSAYASQSPLFDPATSLFVVWLFPNDVLYADTTGTLPGVVPGSPGGANLLANGIANILTTVQTLALGGARHFLVPNMPDLGATPEFLNGPAAPFLSGLTAAFNANLAQQLSLLDAALPNADIVQFDTAALFRDLLADPAEFGFDVADQQCIQNLVNGKCDPSTWVFWDGVHPTTSTHQVLAQQFRAAMVAEPHTLALLLLALGALGWSARRRGGTLSPGAVAPG